jgi:plasmid stabilization system protein ParE
MNYCFHPEAEREMQDSINYYEGCQEGLGYEFAREVYKSIESIREYPKAWPLFEDDIRRRLIHRFPYCILYSEETNEIYILAIMHLNRAPDYWKTRLK